MGVSTIFLTLALQDERGKDRSARFKTRGVHITILRASGLPKRVAQTFSLLYRRLVVGRAPDNCAAPHPFRSLADYRPAIPQIENLRYAAKTFT